MISCFPCKNDENMKNTESNDLRKIICLRKPEVSVEFHFVMSLKNWWSMEYTVCHAL